MPALPSCTRLGIAVVAALACIGRVAHAGDFQVEPTRLDLARRGATTELTLTNRGAAPVSFEAKVVSWRQGPDGAMQLSPTKDIIVYPTLFTIQAGAKRSIRIASAVGQQAAEQTYRILVEELPARRTAAAEAATTTVAVRTQVGVPIFVAATTPAPSKARGQIVGSVLAGQLSFVIENRSAVHVKVANVRVIGTDRAGKVTLDRSQSGWYVLAGGTRAHVLALGATECTPTTQLAIEAATDRGTWLTTIAMPANGCPNAP